MYNITITDIRAGTTVTYINQSTRDLKAWLTQELNGMVHIESITKVIEKPVDVDVLRDLARDLNDGFINKTP